MWIRRERVLDFAKTVKLKLSVHGHSEAAGGGGVFLPQPFSFSETFALTNIKFKAFFLEGVAASSGFAVLLQHQNSLPSLCQDHGHGQAPEATPDHDRVQVGGHRLWGEA